MRSVHELGVPVGESGRVAGSAALVLVTDATPLRPEPALFEAMLAGWRQQQTARRLTVPLIDGRERLIRRFGEFTGGWPWQWTPGQAEVWIAGGAHSTIRPSMISIETDTKDPQDQEPP